MRMIGYIMALISVLAGVGGWFLRRLEVATAFDPISGLPQAGAGVSVLLIFVSLGVVALLFGLSFVLPKKEMPSFADAFGGSVFFTIPLTLFGLIILGLSGLEFFALGMTENLDGFVAARLIAGVFAGLCLILTAIRGYRGSNVAISSAVPVFWLCIWLIVGHIDRAADPVLLRYVYQLFALAALLLALYYIASFAFRQSRPGRMMFCSSVAIYFTGVTMADEMLLGTRFTLLALAATVLIYQLALLHNFRRFTWKDTPYMERDLGE